MKKMCVAIPTHNRSMDVRKKIETERSIYYRYGIDIQVFDSSTNDETRDYIESVSLDNNRGIYYHYYDDLPSSNEKVFRIFEWASESNYEYVWMIHDHTVCNEDAIKHLLSVVEEDADFLILNMQADGYGIEEISDLDSFLLIGAWRLNSFGASVIRTDTFLKGVNWSIIRNKYCDDKTINYSHIGFYYERASELSSPRISQVLFDRKDFVDFNRGNRIQWEAETLRICLECWGEVITRLPGCYRNKLEVLRSQDKWFLSRYSLLSYRKKGFYDLYSFFHYIKWIKLIYPEDLWRDFLISILPYNVGIRVFCRELKTKIKRAVTNNVDVFIFGAGRHAVECASFIKEMEVDFKGFVVTSKSGNPEELMGHRVFEADLILKNRKSLVILAILSSGVEGVKKRLQSIQSCNTIIETVGMT